MKIKGGLYLVTGFAGNDGTKIEKKGACDNAEQKDDQK